MSPSAIKHVSLLLLACTILVGGATTPARAGLVHPGALVSAEEINAARSHVAAGDQPWTTALAWMRGQGAAQLNYVASPVPDVYQGAYGEGDVGGWAMAIDGRAAYLHALIFVMTDIQAHADKSAEIIKAWSSTLESVGGINAKLIGAGAFSGLANAAELLAHSNSGWNAADRAEAEAMFRDICYPLIQDFEPGYNGNWDAIITNSMMAMGVFLDDETIFDRAVDYFRNGVGNGSLPNYVMQDGTTQETWRDVEHENMGISGLTGSAQVARHQGIDLYGYLDNRLLAGAEGVAGRLLSAGWGSGPCWEMLYTHYHLERGLPMPNTEALFNAYNLRPENFGLMQGVGYGTLTSHVLAVPTLKHSVGGLKGHFGD